VHFNLSLAGEDINAGKQPWPVFTGLAFEIGAAIWNAPAMN
jgi:hypothetical protein